MINISLEAYIARSYSNKLTNAYARGLDFQLSLDDMRELITATHCAYTGIRLTSPPTTCKGGIPIDYVRRDTDRTIERVDNSLGYVPGNCVVVCNKANNYKSMYESCPVKMQSFNLEEFIEEIKEIML